ncbi:MAG TPA: hypothetical protein VII76_16260 [Acidimicrobiales bacterium]
MSLAFDVVFGVFVLAIVVLGVLAIRWGVRRDRVARARQAQGAKPGSDAPATPATTPNGHTA